MSRSQYGNVISHNYSLICLADPYISDDIEEVSKQIVEDLTDVSDSVTMAAKVVDGLDTVFLKIKNIVL